MKSANYVSGTTTPQDTDEVTRLLALQWAHSQIRAFLRQLLALKRTVLGCFAVIGIGAIDYFTGAQIALSIFYLIPISALAWYGGKRSALVVSMIGAATWFAADVSSGAAYSHPAIPVWNALSRVTIFTITVLLLSAIRRQQEVLEKNVRERTLQLTNEVTQRQRAQQILSVQYETTRILLEGVSWTEVKGKLLETLCTGLGWDYGAIWMAGVGEELSVEATWCQNRQKPADSDLEIGLQTERIDRLKSVLATGAPVGICNLQMGPFFSGAIFSIGVGQSKTGVVELMSRKVRKSDEERLVMTFGSQIGRFLEHAQAEQDIIQISHAEQQRIAYDLHDGLGQYLSGIAFKAKRLADNLASDGSGRTGDAADIVHFLSNAVGQVRDIARGLDPIDISARGLVSALESLAIQIEDAFGVPCRFKTALEDVPLDAPSSLQLYRIVQEAANNGIRHGGAGHLEIELATCGSHVRLEITDDGNGFVPDRCSGGMGLRVMLHRAHVLGGTLKVISQPGSGTRVQCLVPGRDALAPKLNDL